MAQRDRYVRVRGVAIRTHVRGEGSPLLLLMGLGGSLEMWGPLQRALTHSGIQTIALDLPGVGGSPVTFPPRRIPGLVRIVDGILDVLGYDRVDVLGLSFGGAVAQHLAWKAPDRVRRLVLAATTPGVGGVPGHPLALLYGANPLWTRSPRYFRRVAPIVLGGRTGRNGGPIAGHWTVRRAGALGYVGQLYAITGWASLPWLHRIPHPTLVLAGDDDPLVPLVNARILATAIRRSQLVVIPGGGHLFLLDQPEDVVGHLLAFFNST